MATNITFKLYFHDEAPNTSNVHKKASNQNAAAISKISVTPAVKKKPQTHTTNQRQA